IIGSSDPDYPDEAWRPLPNDWWNTQSDQPDYFVFDRRNQRLAGEKITVRVERSGGEPANIVVGPAHHVTLRMPVQMGQITAGRADSPGAKAGVHPLNAELKGDILEQVEVTGKDGKTVRFVFPSKDGVHQKQPGLLIDPSRLPFELKQWAASVKGG